MPSAAGQPQHVLTYVCVCVGGESQRHGDREWQSDFLTVGVAGGMERRSREATKWTRAPTYNEEMLTEAYLIRDSG